MLKEVTKLSYVDSPILDVSDPLAGVSFIFNA